MCVFCIASLFSLNRVFVVVLYLLFLPSCHDMPLWSYHPWFLFSLSADPPSCDDLTREGYSQRSFIFPLPGPLFFPFSPVRGKWGFILLFFPLVTPLSPAPFFDFFGGLLLSHGRWSHLQRRCFFFPRPPPFLLLSVPKTILGALISIRASSIVTCNPFRCL